MSKEICNFCDKDAVYDGKTVMGPWAYMCPLHFKIYGCGLGIGKGQKLKAESGNVIVKNREF